MENRSRNIWLTIVVGVFILSVLFLSSCNIWNTSVYNLEIAEDENNVWRVFDQEGNNRGTLDVSPNDEVNWQAVNSNLEFEFEVDVRKYFEFEENLFQDNMTQTVPEGERLHVTIREDAPFDTLTYHIFVESADTFVVRNSPPVMIIKSRK